MTARCRSRFGSAAVALAVALLASAPARAGEPSAKDLIALAPVIDSSDRNCRSIDVGGLMGDDHGPKLRFRALYRAPDRSSFLISDAMDGTPLAYCSGGKVLVYDPVGPTVYYSERGGFVLRLACDEKEVKFEWAHLIQALQGNRIAIDLRSVLSNDRNPGKDTVRDVGVGPSSREFELVRKIAGGTSFVFRIDPARPSPYISAAGYSGPTPVLRIDRMIVDGPLDDALFAFPAKRTLARRLPLRDVTADDDPARLVRIVEVVSRANVIRMILSEAPSSAVPQVQGISGSDWVRIRENDRKYSGALRGLVPPGLRAR